MNRRKFFKSTGAGASLFLLTGHALLTGKEIIKSNTMEQMSTSKILFPALPYAYDALEPWIDARTMEIHYDKHHRAYYNNFVAAIKGTESENLPAEEILKMYHDILLR